MEWNTLNQFHLEENINRSVDSKQVAEKKSSGSL
jgi:hypothetical protein